MATQTLKSRIDAIESEISEVDVETRNEMIARLRQLVLTLDMGGSISRSSSTRRFDPRYEEAAEDAFDNMPI